MGCLVARSDSPGSGSRRSSPEAEKSDTSRASASAERGSGKVASDRLSSMRPQRLSNAELDALAQGHVQYEVAMLVGQACDFHRKYPEGMPPSGGFKDPIVDDALLEATLVHLRLLDDFLRSVGTHPCDVRASDWVPKRTWQPTKDWLKPDIRRRINWQVAHLSVCRDSWFDWDVRGYGYACCKELESFVLAVGNHNPGCLRAFDAVETCIAQGLECLVPG